MATDTPIDPGTINPAAGNPVPGNPLTAAPMTAAPMTAAPMTAAPTTAVAVPPAPPPLTLPVAPAGSGPTTGSLWPSPSGAPLPPPAPLRPRRTALIIIVVVLAALGLLVVAALLLLGADQLLTHDLVDADFETAPTPFVTATSDSYRLGVQDGTYRISTTEGWTPDEGPAISFGHFARVAYVVDVTTEIASISDAQRVMVGVGCAAAGDAANTYSLVVIGDTALLVHVPGGGKETMAENIIARTTVPAVRAGTVLGLRCSWPLVGTGIGLDATIDGVPVLSGTHSADPDDGGFDAMVLDFQPDAPGGAVAFAWARAHVPE